MSLVLAAFAAASALTFADVEVKLDDAELAKKGAGIRVLYVTLYDADSAKPMPYGAMRVQLDKDAAKGTVYKAKLTSENVAVMGGGDAPKNLRIKARLDKDGSAGPDGAGDLVGIKDKVALGSSTTIVIDKAH